MGNNTTKNKIVIKWGTDCASGSELKIGDIITSNNIHYIVLGTHDNKALSVVHVTTAYMDFILAQSFGLRIRIPDETTRLYERNINLSLRYNSEDVSEINYIKWLIKNRKCISIMKS